VSTTAQRWTTEDIAGELEFASTASVRKWISRLRAKGEPAGTPIGLDLQTGERWYDPKLVTAARAASPGRGWRAGHTDTDRGVHHG